MSTSAKNRLTRSRSGSLSEFEQHHPNVWPPPMQRDALALAQFEADWK